MTTDMKSSPKKTYSVHVAVTFIAKLLCTHETFYRSIKKKIYTYIYIYIYIYIYNVYKLMSNVIQKISYLLVIYGWEKI